MPDDSNSNQYYPTTWVGELALLDGRPLTPGEIADAQSVFGDAVDYTQIRVLDSNYDSDDRMSAWDGAISAPESRYRADFSAADTPLIDRATFQHELTHLFQDQLGLDMSAEMDRVAADGKGNYDNGYDYVLDPSKGFLDYNIEQQAQIVRDYFGVSNGSAKPATAANLLPKYHDVLPFDAFGGERSREPVVAPINEDGSPANAASPREPIVAPINEDGSPLGSQPPASPAPPQAGFNNPGPSTAPNAEPSEPEELTLSEEDALSLSPSQPGSSLEPATPPPAAADEPAKAAPKPSAEPPAPQPEGPTLAELLGDEYVDPNEERAVTEDEGNEGNEDDDEEQGTGGTGNEMPNPMDDGPSYVNADSSVLLNRNAPYVNPGPGGIDMAIVGDIDPSVLLNRNAPYVNPGSEDYFDVTAGGSGDYTVLLNRNAPYVNPGLGDIDMPVGDVDLSVLLNRNGPRQTSGPGDADMLSVSSTFDDSLPDIPMHLDLDLDLENFELL